MARGVKMGCTLWVITLLVLALITTSPTNAVIGCNDLLERIFACSAFVSGGSNSPSAECCAALQDLDSMAEASQPERQAICKCFQGINKFYRYFIPRASDLIELCDLESNISIDADVDCSQYIPVNLT
ncbi:hypothetical protein RJ640_005705 [Escallonia rubra]|uniref:Bifunctional inhibitor/plant lipid transfer protein/seed storage helical domain-containing protein n=1 Tax=Escallonia rubra TaxID=112253 RepID=A0AA88UT59_9ASTE|nr:hypothetical protein RJ640_005705 [Escallonia rubra]